MLRREEGQILPGLLVIMLAVLAVGVMMFQVGKAALLRSGAQTGADAAALAGATEIKRQLMAQWATYGYTDVNLVNRAMVTAKMAEYAKKNKTTLVLSKVVIQGVDVKATVTTDADLGKEGGQVKNADEDGEAKARARLELASIPGIGGGGGSIGPTPGGSSGGAAKFSKGDWEKLGKEINNPPSCADLVKLGKLLQSKGFNVSENTAFGGVQYKHASGGYHYKCGGGGALDVNIGGAGDLDPTEVASVDPIIDDLRKLGFRTIWRAPDHFNHLHVDVANTPNIGGGSGGNIGGFAGPLEDVLMEVKLIDYEAAYAPFGGLGGVGGGFFGGPPDPKAARAICTVARDLGASPKVLLAAYEAAIVESGVHSLPYGDRDSIGLFQQRDSWGSYAQRMNPEWASRQFLVKAIRQNESWMSAGQLAQDVQVSAFPDRYDQVRSQAMSLIGQYCSGGSS